MQTYKDMFVCVPTVASGAILQPNGPGVRSNQDALGSHGQRIPMS